MYQLSLETSVCVKRKWNINVPLSNLMEHLYSNSKVKALFLVRQARRRAAISKTARFARPEAVLESQNPVHQRLEPIRVGGTMLCANEAPYFASNFSREAISSARNDESATSLSRDRKSRCRTSTWRAYEHDGGEACLASGQLMMHRLLRLAMSANGRMTLYHRGLISPGSK
jgi:hypothetical protein